MPAKYIIKIDPDIREIIPDFLERRRQDVVKLRQFIQSQEFQSLQMMGHRLKSSSPGYGFIYLGTLGSRLENAALAESLERAVQAVDAIEEFLNNLELDE